MAKEDPQAIARKAIQKWHDKWAAGAKEAWVTLDSETDRGRALVAAEWLSDLLELLLRKQFELQEMTQTEQDEILKDFAPLGSFSARTSICRAFGLIRPKTFQSLTAIRKIRNHFAHSHGAASMSDKEIERWVRVLRQSVPNKWYTSPKNPIDTRPLMKAAWKMLSVTILKSRTRITRKQITRHKRQTKAIQKQLAKPTANKPQA